MRLVIVARQEYDQYDVDVAYPVEAESQEWLRTHLNERAKVIVEAKSASLASRKYPADIPDWDSPFAFLGDLSFWVSTEAGYVPWPPEVFTLDEWFEGCIKSQEA